MTEHEDDDRPELDAERALEALRWMWGEFYEIWIEQGIGRWLARRLDGGGVIEGSGPDELRVEILEDWLLHPVVVRR
jgi:hypothetical protein